VQGRATATPRLRASGVAALLVAAAGAVHLYLWFDYFHRVHVVGVLFLVNAGAGIAVALALLGGFGVPALLAGAGYSAATLVAFAVSTRWSLFGYRERFWGSWQEAAGAIELCAFLVIVPMLRPSALRFRRTPAESR
jgi:hypothetical protein